ncbi:MAG TPA: GlmL-related ornithine degradation protein [Anaerovoracaceae bacterium]|nr:GlmL-related ornithine degradation protein [Anaerovoracaceae bacterium]
MKIDVLVAEIGSTTTIVNAFDNIKTSKPVFWGQGQAATSVLEGDVRVGLKEAIDDLCKRKGVSSVEYGEMLATSSAAGGLKMSVHGLVYDMTVRAAKEAALGAGAILHLVTAGRLSRTDLLKIKEVSPNLIMIAGGVDYGERNTAIYNAEMIRSLDIATPVIYGGNVQNHDEIRLIFKDSKAPLYIVGNVYPKIDELNVEPARKVIQAAFEDHIVQAPGMEHIRDMVNGSIIPTPGAVMEGARLLYGQMGDLMVLDVGGATTDLHSVTDGSEEISRISISPEPKAKRTVEGDLGVYINVRNILESIGYENLSNELGFDISDVAENHKFIPSTDDEIRFVERLTKEAVIQATKRHAGRIRYVYGPTGRSTLAEGKDLSKVKYIIGTGGALTNLPNRIAILRDIAGHNETGLLLFPDSNAKILIDENYIMASLGVLSKHYKDAAVYLLRESLES